MAETAYPAAGSEAPVNPYNLLEAVNRSGDTAHTGWLIFLGLMAYLMIAVAGVTHRDLLLETPPFLHFGPAGEDGVDVVECLGAHLCSELSVLKVLSSLSCAVSCCHKQT